MIIVNCLLIALAVMLHYEVLMKLSKILPHLNIKHRFRVAVGLIGALIAHVAEVWLFAFAYYFLIKQETFGNITGAHDGSLMDCVYFSFVNYST
ncbi:MAG: two pore domain potassium channel family protein, partial [Gammaproteobacteria bacterium]|nr:two pore domain potassium channel family protein [Gammaproteobacteria bacterium]